MKIIPKYRLIKDVLKNDYQWLENDIMIGSVVYAFAGCTYGCISHNGRAFTKSSDGNGEFFELPWDSVELIK